MPSMRRRANVNELSEFERGRIIGLQKSGSLFREIGNVCMTLPVWNDWIIEQRLERRRGTGAVRATRDREERLLRVNAHRNRIPTSR